MVSVQSGIEIQGDLNLASLSRKLDEVNIPKEILKSVLVKLQEEIVVDLCGPPYLRVNDRQFKRVGTTDRTLCTRHGKVSFKLAKVYSKESDASMRPLLLFIGVEPRRRIVEDLVLECAETATYLTYRDSKAVIENLTWAKVSRTRIHECVQRVGEFMNEERRKTPAKDQSLIEGDSTKCHGLKVKKNEIKVILGKDLETSEKSLLALGVNEDWKETAGQFRGRADFAVSDNEPCVRNALLEKAANYQACVRHSVGDVRFYLWSAGLPKMQRKEIVNRLTGILETLHKSVNKHLVDKDFERLRWRIYWTLSELDKLGRGLLEDGLDAAAGFIRNAANYLVTFARLAMKETRIPLTNNLVERLMGEIAKRVKHKWMHWSTKGLENLLNILLARYCNRRVYDEMKEKYLNPNSTKIQITIT